MSKYAQFNGRAGLMEFWMFVLFGLVIIPLFVKIIVHTFFSVFFEYQYSIMYFYWLIILVPFLALQSRRLQDTNKSPWLLLLYFVPLGVFALIVMYALPSEEEKISHAPNVKPILKPEPLDKPEQDKSNVTENVQVKQRSSGTGSNCALGITGMFIGAFIGAISGYGMGQSQGYSGADSIGSIVTAFVGIVVGAIIGLIVGFIIGAMINSIKK